MKLYHYTEVDKLIERFISKGGEAIQTDEGVLGSGSWILHGEKLKTIVITEVATGSWSSAHTIRCYNKTPKKYQTIIDNA